MLWAACILVLAFLILPILIIVPLSFSSGTFLTFPLPGLSLRWYQEFFTSAPWQLSLRNSLIVASATTALASVLGTLAALGLTRAAARPDLADGADRLAHGRAARDRRGRGLFRLCAVRAHQQPGRPHAGPYRAGRAVRGDHGQRDATGLRPQPGACRPGRLARGGVQRIILPLILPGVISGALFAFVTSFDEVVVALFVTGPAERTLPRQMFNGIRENISPVIAARDLRDPGLGAPVERARAAPASQRTPARDQALSSAPVERLHGPLRRLT